MIFNPDTIEQLFGHEAAERDNEIRLKTFYFKSHHYEEVISSSSLKILIGFKGTGKSALMKMAYIEGLDQKQMSLWLRPDDMLGLYTSSLNTLNDAISYWKAELPKIIVRNILDEYTFANASNFEKEIQWAGEAGHKSKDFIPQLIEKIDVALLEAIYRKHHCSEIIEHFLDTKTLTIYIDDLDRGWTASKNDKNNLSALLNTLGDLTSTIKGFRARISLRTDVYVDVRGQDQSQDKFESNQIWVTWTNHEILAMLAKRVATYIGTDINEDISDLPQREIAKYIYPVFEEKFEGTPTWNGQYTYKVLMSLIRKRPRDLIKLCHLSAKVANKFKASKINGNHIYSVLDTYSRGRFDDIVIEFQTQLPQIQDILRRMGPTTKELQDPTIDNVYKFQTDRLITKISNIKQNISIDLTPMEIARYLYKIGFITARKTLPSNKLDRRYFDEHPDLLKGHIGDMGYGWEIHPAYRGALNRGELQKWYETIDIVDES